MEQDKLLLRVRKLIAMAEAEISPAATDKEREATLQEQARARAMADALMLENSIKEAQLRDAKPVGERSKPGIMLLTMPRGDVSWTWQSLARLVADHCRCKIKHYAEYSQDDDAYMSKVYGWESDIHYFEVMFTTLSLHMLDLLAPQIRGDLSEDENIYRLHRAGHDYRDIAEMYGYRLESKGSDWLVKDGERHRYGKIVGRYRAAYKRELARRGEDPTRIWHAQTYRDSAAQGYMAGIRQRLTAAARGRDDDTSGGAALVLASSMDDLNQFYREDNKDAFTTCPHCGLLSTNPYVCSECKKKIADPPPPPAECEKCKKNPSHTCREHPRYGYGREAAFDSRAYGAGVAHAKTADLGGGKVGGRKTALR